MTPAGIFDLPTPPASRPNTPLPRNYGAHPYVRIFQEVLEVVVVVYTFVKAEGRSEEEVDRLLFERASEEQAQLLGEFLDKVSAHVHPAWLSDP